MCLLNTQAQYRMLDSGITVILYISKIDMTHICDSSEIILSNIKGCAQSSCKAKQKMRPKLKYDDFSVHR